MEPEIETGQQALDKFLEQISDYQRNELEAVPDDMGWTIFHGPSISPVGHVGTDGHVDRY